MFDAALIREQLPFVEARLRTRGMDPSRELAELSALDAERRRLIPVVETLKRESNEAAESVARAKREGRDPSDIFAANKERAQAIRTHEAALAEIEARRDALLLTLPNLPHESVPIGLTDKDNVEVRRWGTPRQFTFEPKPHWDLGAALGILDFERATRMSAARFSVLSGEGARLARGLINFMLDVHTREHGYREVEPPFLVNGKALTGTGQLPKFADDLFRIAGEWDLYLVPTAEVPLTNLHREELIDAKQLPIKYTAYTPCFRSEAGSYGKDVRGIYRQHQFDKVELVKLTTVEQSAAELEALTADAESILRRLEIPYRTVEHCTGDLGFSASKSYDIEVWLPGRGDYAEISSCSNTDAFQARRAQIRYKAAGGGKNQFVHTLNGSGLAVGRTLIAILENGQQEDGSVTIPAALQPYVGFDRIGGQ
jgi:seryl-tRNA synthetase